MCAYCDNVNCICFNDDDFRTHIYNTTSVFRALLLHTGSSGIYKLGNGIDGRDSYYRIA